LSTFHHAPTPQFHPLSLHDALPISLAWRQVVVVDHDRADRGLVQAVDRDGLEVAIRAVLVPDTELRAQRHTRLRQQLFEELLARSEEHTSELQSRVDLVCRLLVEKK